MSKWRMAAFAGGLLFSLGLPLNAQKSGITIVLVRHAEKAAAPANDPPLTDAGKARAESLSVALADFAPEAIIVTPFARTRGTAEPLATRFGLTPVLAPQVGTIPQRADSLAAMVRGNYDGKRVVIIGHSNTIPGIIGALGGPKLADLCDQEHATMFTLTIPAGGGQPRLVRSRYGPADPPNAGECHTMKH
jgi:broad specificity phosphatase PhoE